MFLTAIEMDHVFIIFKTSFITSHSLLFLFTALYVILPVHGHDPSRAAVPTLGTVEVSQSALHFVVPLGSVADAFHCHHLEPMTRIHGKHALQ